MKLKFLLILAITIVSVIFTTACSPSIRYSALNETYAGTQSRLNPVKVYVTKAPECDYEELGIVSASTGSSSSDFAFIDSLLSGGSNTFIELMRQQAVSVGGDAIILREKTAVNDGMIETNPGEFRSTIREQQSGVIIRFANEECLE